MNHSRFATAHRATARTALRGGLLLMLLFTLGAQAETVAIPLGQQGKAWQVETPNKGTSKARVEARFGTPVKKTGPVGDPPIYTWEYEQFAVYFEGDYVIHSVVKFDPSSRDPATP